MRKSSSSRAMRRRLEVETASGKSRNAVVVAWRRKHLRQRRCGRVSHSRTSRATALGALKTNEKMASSAATLTSTGVGRAAQKQRADKHLGPKVRQRGNPLYLAVPGRPWVSVRILHGFLRVHCRSISGSLLHWRISGWPETFPEQGQTRVVVDSHRGVATQQFVAAPLLSDSPPHRHAIYTLAARDHGRGSRQNPRAKCQNPCRDRARRASETTQGETAQAVGGQT